MSDSRTAADPPIDDPPIDDTKPGKEVPIGDPPGVGEPPKEAPPAHTPDTPPEKPDEKPKPVERIQKLRVGVRAIWWSALVLTLAFAGLALWMGFGRRDPFALFFILLAGLCALAGYGAVASLRQR